MISDTRHSPKPARFGPEDRLRRFPRLESAATLIAVAMPLVLLAALGICAGRRYWTQWRGGGHLQASRSGKGHAGFAHRPQRPSEMKYEGDGRANLGDYSVKIYDPVTRTALRADFALEGETSCGDRPSFDNWLAGHRYLLREQVMIAVRNGNVEEFTDPKLGLLSRKIVARVNRILGRPFLKSVRFKGFVLYESVQNSEFTLWEEARNAGG